MAAFTFASGPVRRLSIATIDAVVSARLGPTRVSGNEQPACFNRQIAMYLARRVGGWSTTVMGRFYNGRDHSTVCYGIQRIESLRESDPEVDALITEIKEQLGQEFVGGTEMIDPLAEFAGISQATIDRLADLVAARVWAYLEERIHRSQELTSSPTNQF